MTINGQYASVHQIHSLDAATENDLSLLIRTYPIIDNHAHNLLKEEYAHGGGEYPFECIVSEAHGPALHGHGEKSLAHIRGIRQLAELFGCLETIEDVKEARNKWIKRDYAGLIHKCLEGSKCSCDIVPKAVVPEDTVVYCRQGHVQPGRDNVLTQDHIHTGKWHRKYVPRVSRIVRIEAIAAELLMHLAQSAGLLKPGLDGDWEKDHSEGFLMRFNTMFRNQIRNLAQDPNVRGFKSVVCYRSGLDVNLDSRNLFRPHHSLSESTLLEKFHNFIQQAVLQHNYHIQQKEVNDYLVVAVCDVLEKLVDADGENLPFQFHTGLGDTDIDLVKANPAYMQPLIEAFPNVDFVLLHSSYPYTREAGYLATNYANAWLDIGEVFPMLSRDGEEKVLRQALELTPTSKILWSTDGHFYPESFYLANKQFRTVLEKVLLGYVQDGDITVAQAVDIAVSIMFWNSNSLYKLDEESRYPQLVAACGKSSSQSVKTVTNVSSRRGSVRSKASIITIGKTNSGSVANPITRRSIGSISANTSSTALSTKSLTIVDDFVQVNPDLKYIWAQFVDYTGTTRLRMIPLASFKKHILTGKYPGITSALPRLLQNELPAEGCSPVGEFLLLFDTASLSLNKVISSPSATVQSYWMVSDGPHPSEHYYACPRWALRKQLNTLKQKYDISVLMGFEIEVVFVKPIFNKEGSDFERFEAHHLCHSWSNMTVQQLDMVPMIEEIVETLASVDIHVSQFHAEAAPGQWEFPLPAFEPVKAVDVLYKARDIIRMVARKHGVKATLYPRPYPTTCGSASHVHFSINGTDEIVAKYQDSFLAGILEQLPSILAFTLPIEESYQRVQPGVWGGGEYVAWGTQNREAAIRKCDDAHWELKTIDGIGNAYLSMAALTAAGLDGIERNLELTLSDCPYDASVISAEQRADYGIKTLLPKSIMESLANLDENSMLREKLGDGLVDDYVAVKKAEAAFLDNKDEEDRRTWLISRY